MVLRLLKGKEAPERTQQPGRAGRALGTRRSTSRVNWRGRLARGGRSGAARALAWADPRLRGLAVAVRASSCNRQGRDKVTAPIPQMC